jgi:hypothetical protein
MNAPALRTRSVGEILDLAFQLYRGRWAAMTTATAILVLPVIVLQAMIPLVGMMILNLLLGLFYLAASGAVVVIASETYMGRDVTPLAAVGRVLRRFFSVWGAAFMQGIIVGIGFLLLIVPGIFFAAWTFAMQQAVMIEGMNTSDSFERSKELAEDHVLHVLMTGVMTFVIGYFAVIGISMAAGMFITDVRGLLLFQNVVHILINPLPAVVGTVLYYDLRIRKEAFDVSVATDRLGPVPPAAVPAL